LKGRRVRISDSAQFFITLIIMYSDCFFPNGSALRVWGSDGGSTESDGGKIWRLFGGSYRLVRECHPAGLHCDQQQPGAQKRERPESGVTHVIDEAAVFLASSAAKYIPGAVPNVDGGWLAH
jgi:NAD(P)-dependent dehydrogenase (short-subunit alcohol dehydrogenase family)